MQALVTAAKLEESEVVLHSEAGGETLLQTTYWFSPTGAEALKVPRALIRTIRRKNKPSDI